MTRLPLLLISIGFFFLSSVAWAQTPGTVIGKTASIYEQPDGASETLVKLKKGNKVTVLSEQGGWVQLKVNLSKGFTFTGWGDKRLFKYAPLKKTPVAKGKRAVAGSPVVARSAPPAAPRIPQPVSPPVRAKVVMPLPSEPPLSAASPTGGEWGGYSKNTHRRDGSHGRGC